MYNSLIDYLEEIIEYTNTDEMLKLKKESNGEFRKKIYENFEYTYKNYPTMVNLILDAKDKNDQINKIHGIKQQIKIKNMNLNEKDENFLFSTIHELQYYYTSIKNDKEQLKNFLKEIKIRKLAYPNLIDIIINEKLLNNIDLVYLLMNL